MKKRAIEQIPYLGLPNLVRKKEVRYAAVTSVQEINREKHLMIEIYRNEKACRDIPEARIVITEKDFGTYLPGSGTWSRAMIQRGGDIKENILYSGEDMDRIKGFTQNIQILWGEQPWWEYVRRKQEEIAASESRKRTERRYERRQQALKERQDHTQELPEKKILRYADIVLFHDAHHLYYKKHGSRAAVACSKCGGVTDARWKPGQSYESQYERLIEEPRTGYYGICPMCGVSGTYIAQGLEKRYRREAGHLFLGQRYKDHGMVFRYIKVEKEWHVGIIPGEKGEEMYNSCEELSGTEIARIYFEPGKKIQKDYHKHDPYGGKDFWDDCNLYGMANIAVGPAVIMPETFENMKGTFLQYSALQEYQGSGRIVNPAAYLERYIQTPQMEILVKMGLVKVADELVSCHYGIVADADAGRLDGFLGIRKERTRQLIRHHGDVSILKVMQIEKRLDKRWTDEQIEKMKELDLGYQISTAIEHMEIQKFLNRVEAYAGCGYGTMCTAAESRLRRTAQTYLDYLSMRKDLGYDMRNTVYLFPKDLGAAHSQMVREHNRIEADKRIREVNARFPMIKKDYRSLRKKFYFEDEEFLIRPARDAGEIVMEGRILHHCVGGDSYLNKHNAGRSTILFLRKQADPETPYITAEIREDLHLAQWYGANDKKPDEKRMQKWLDNYVTRLKCSEMPAAVNSQGETGQQMPAYA